MGFKELWQGVRSMWSGSYQPQKSKWLDVSFNTRVSEWQTAIALYEGRQSDVLDWDLRQTFEAMEASQLAKQKLCFNVIKRIVDKTAMLYKEEPTYTCESNPQLVDAIGGNGGPLKCGDRYSELCGIAWVHPRWDDEQQKVEFVVIPPDQVEPRFNPYNFALEELTFFSYIQDGAHTQVLRTVWTDETFIILRESKDVTDEVLSAMGLPENPQRVNPYGVIPYAPMRPRIPLYGEPLGQYREDLVSAQRTLNLRLTDMQFLIKMQAGSQLVIEGKPEGDFCIGLGKPLIIPPEIDGGGGANSAYYLSPSARITEVWQGIVETVKHLSNLNGIPSNWFDGGIPASGEALRLSLSDLTEYREDKQDSHTMFWRDFSKVCASVLKVDGKRGNGRADGFTVEFGAPEPYQSPEEAADEWERLIKAGVRQKWEWVADERGLDEDEAKAFLAESQAQERQMISATRPQAPPPGAFLANLNRNVAQRPTGEEEVE
jgi:hypothetical protein